MRVPAWLQTALIGAVSAGLGVVGASLISVPVLEKAFELKIAEYDRSFIEVDAEITDLEGDIIQAKIELTKALRDLAVKIDDREEWRDIWAEVNEAKVMANENSSFIRRQFRDITADRETWGAHKRLVPENRDDIRELRQQLADHSH